MVKYCCSIIVAWPQDRVCAIAAEFEKEGIKILGTSRAVLCKMKL
jgi:hypothetical protein